MTYADKIRAMTDEEIALFLAMSNAMRIMMRSGDALTDERRRWLHWLRREADSPVSITKK